MLGREDWLFIIYFVVDILEVLLEYVVLNNKCYFWVGLEFVGMCFYEVVKCIVGVNMKFVEEEEEVVFDMKDKESDFFLVDFYGFKGKKLGDGVENQDYYVLFGLSYLRFLVIEDQIRKSYREVVLKYYFDKYVVLFLIEEIEEKKEIKKDEID